MTYDYNDYNINDITWIKIANNERDEELNNKIREYIINLENHIIPDKMDMTIAYHARFMPMKNIFLDRDIFDIRKYIITISCFPLLSKDWIKQLANAIGDKKVLSVCSGLGALEKCLKDCGVDIIATDTCDCGLFKGNDIWMNVEQIDAIEAIKKYGKLSIIYYYHGHH